MGGGLGYTPTGLDQLAASARPLPSITSTLSGLQSIKVRVVPYGQGVDDADARQRTRALQLVLRRRPRRGRERSIPDAAPARQPRNRRRRSRADPRRNQGLRVLPPFAADVRHLHQPPDEPSVSRLPEAAQRRRRQPHRAGGHRRNAAVRARVSRGYVRAERADRPLLLGRGDERHVRVDHRRPSRARRQPRRVRAGARRREDLLRRRHRPPLLRRSGDECGVRGCASLDRSEQLRGHRVRRRCAWVSRVRVDLRPETGRVHRRRERDALYRLVDAQAVRRLERLESARQRRSGGRRVRCQFRPIAVRP